MMINLTAPFGDRPQATLQTLPTQNAYVLVNNDDADRILVDPAYRLEKYTKSIKAIDRLREVETEVEKQLAAQKVTKKVQYDREMYETWLSIEKQIRKLDRQFNKVEKFESRRFADPDNFERREARMLERQRGREHNNFTYFFGSLTEQEQQYRDYYQTDIEQDPENEVLEGAIDEHLILSTGDFSHKRFDFVEQSLLWESHEAFEDVVEDKIFKFKYRKATDYGQVYQQRQARVIEKFVSRMEHRDPAVAADVQQIMTKSDLNLSTAAIALGETEGRPTHHQESKPLRDYMLAEAIQQYKDYYEDDKEEHSFFEYLDEMSTRDQIRFMEVFEDHSLQQADNKRFVKIPKREPNPEISLMGNFALDFVDFKDRVRFLARDLTLQDVAHKHQRLSRQEV